MFSILGYNFLADGNALDAVPVQLNNVNDITIQNGEFDHFNMTHDVTTPYSSTIPTTWELLTMLNASFEGTLNAGNVEYNLSQLSAFKIKRRKKTDFNWITLGTLPIESSDQLQFLFKDNLPQSLDEYEYGFVPIINGVEGNYITNTIKTNFKGVFICDQDTIYRFYAGVSYGGAEQVQKIGVLEPVGQQYPIFVSNALTNYGTYRMEGTVLQNDYSETREIDPYAIVKERKELIKFLTNKKPKIVKDWNGNSWLIMVTGNLQTTYANNSGMKLMNVGFNYTEAGDSELQSDLVRTGMIAGDS